MIRIALAALTFVLSHAGLAETLLVGSQDEFEDAVDNLKPGDTIMLANGAWRDFEILFTGFGTAEQPITLTAETRGEVFITGQSNLRMAGKYLVVSGLIFRDGHTPTNTVISFRRTRGDPAYHSRVTETVIDRFNNPERHETDFWVMMYGRHNRFDHNHLVGKSNAGVTMAVRLDGEESRENHHRIDHNYFGPRPILGANGGETLRIGTSHHSRTDSFTVVENNYFDRCNGELEVISNKSGGNTFRGNLFFESRGTLTLRHGNGTVVENNVFLGNRADHTGGIRVINADQVVRNNYMHGLTGHRFGGALVVMNGVPNSPLNRYDPVVNAVIENNSIIDSDHVELGAGSDEERSATPTDSVFGSNLIFNEDGRNIVAVHDDVGGIEFRGNATNNVDEPALTEGFVNASLELVAADNRLLYPADGQFADVGASRELKVLDPESTGVSWYPKAGSGMRFDTGETIFIGAGEDAIFDAAAGAGAGDVIMLAPGGYLLTKTIVVDRPLTIRAAPGTASIEFERTALFEIADGGSLKLSGLTISGRAAPDVAGNSAIRTHRYSMLGNYALVVEDSTIQDLNTNHSFNFLSVARHTFADRIEIANSVFRNITGHVLSLAQETDDLGLYNGEYVSMVGSTFQNIEGAVADIYRGGTDESTFGPHFELRASSLDSVGKGSRNKSAASIRLLGVQATDIFDNVVADSRPVRVIHTVGDPVTRLGDNRLERTPEPIVREFGGQ
ncbi:MAG: polysaccharide lyase 6 family protein [Gammaproteobacteria bacterium]|nr:polysaccharide lyase 6 family protein [Gammaproteobacteria bacterium]